MSEASRLAKAELRDLEDKKVKYNNVLLVFNLNIQFIQIFSRVKEERVRKGREVTCRTRRRAW